MENKTNAQSTGQTSNAGNAGSGQSNAFNMEALTGMLGNAQIPDKLKEYGEMAMKKVNNLSTTQKVIGGALLVLGAGYLSRKSKTGLGGMLAKGKR